MLSHSSKLEKLLKTAFAPPAPLHPCSHTHNPGTVVASSPAGNLCRHHPIQLSPRLHFSVCPRISFFCCPHCAYSLLATRPNLSPPSYSWLSPLWSCVRPSCCFVFTMSGKGKSRWADSEEDAAREAKARKEKEEKKRLKREKAEAARRAEEESRRQAAVATAQGDDDNQEARPAKRRRLTPERPSEQQAKGKGSSSAVPRLLRFQAAGGFGKSNSVEKYDKLNDIEEGAYGWVARAKEIATGKVVALKRLKIEPNDRNGLPVTGLREIQILKDCEHRNIVELKEVVVGEDTTKIEKCVIHGNPSAPVLP